MEQGAGGMGGFGGFGGFNMGGQGATIEDIFESMSDVFGDFFGVKSVFCACFILLGDFLPSS